MTLRLRPPEPRRTYWYRMIMPGHVVVFSHRRSGTHLTIDAIRNNFPTYRLEYLNLDEVLHDPGNSKLHSIEHELDAAPHVVKCHAPAELDRHFPNPESAALASELAQTAKCIYVVRDGRDVMVSYYHYASSIDPAIKQAGLTAFLHMQDPLGIRPAFRNLDNVEYWHHHVSSWLARRGVFFISFKAWIEDYEAQIVRLAEFLELNMPRRITNVVRRSRNRRGDTKLWNRAWEKAYKLLNRYVTGRDFTTVNFRVGKTNAYLTTFSDEDLSFFESKAGDLLTRLGYATSLRVG